MSKLNVSGRELELVKDLAKVHRTDGMTLFLRRDLELDPRPFMELLASDEPGKTMQPNKGRFVIKSMQSGIGPLAVKRFHYHRTYRRKQRWFMGYAWQAAQGPQQFVRSLYAFSRGHRVVEPVLALRRPVGRARQESLLVTRMVVGRSLKNLFLDPAVELEDKFVLFRHGLGALKSMHSDGIAFGDAQTRHQIMDAAGWLWWLDFDKMAISSAGYCRRDRDLRRFFSSALLRISQSGADFDAAFEGMLQRLDATYPLHPIWRRILILEIGKRLKRMRKRPGFQRM